MTADDSLKTRDELLAELRQLHRQVAELCAAAGADRRRAARADNEGLLQTIVANTPVIVGAVDRAGVITLAEGKGLERLRRKPEQLVGQAVPDVCKDLPGVEEELFEALGGEPGTARLKGDGLVWEVWYIPLRGQQGEVVGAAGMAIDVTAHERAEKRLRGGQRRLQQILQSHERDRRLIAYEIHDGLVQDATAALMRLESVLQEPQLPPAVRKEVQVAASLVGKSVAQARQLISGLRLPILDELGVVAAIEYLIQSGQGERPSVKFAAQVQFVRLEPLLEATVYRIVQEAVTNVKRHSQSDRCGIRLTQVGDRLQIEVEDWGIGFDPASVGKDRFGLQGIRERSRLLGGRAVISSAPGKGTRILVDLPVVPALHELAIANSGSME